MHTTTSKNNKNQTETASAAAELTTASLNNQTKENSVDEISMDKIETMEQMTKCLRGTSGGAQAKAVAAAIRAINKAPGMLDAENRALALFHLSVALSGRDSAARTLGLSAGLFRNVK